ncbi:hypothetical protein A0H76_1701 [Hepatospora eriocheir]|uniref:Uncharacterized protein n=2 Tax=Hepatospora eriocheir TaxID=1081669 RepID=A0A1X0QLI5_9MICR|nr:hypothetical protein A0H76_1701 [Hepatospora eriocheir]
MNEDPFEVKVKNNYGGCIMEVEVIRKDEEAYKDLYGMYLKIEGYLETYNIKMKIWESRGLELNNVNGYSFSEFNYNKCLFKIIINRDVPPSMITNHFKIFYQADTVLLCKTIKYSLAFPLKILNSNLFIKELEFPLSNEEYQYKKKSLCKLLLETNQNTIFDDLSPIYKKEQININEYCLDKATNFYRNNPNLLSISSKLLQFKLNNKDNKPIAIVSLKEIGLSKMINRIHIELKDERIKNINVFIIEEHLENDVIIDGTVIFDKSYSGQNLLEKNVFYRPENFSLKTNVIEIRHSLTISFDSLELAIPLIIGNSKSKLKFC